MDRSQILTLIAETYTPDNIGQMIPQETTRDVYVDVASVTLDEIATAGREGLHPALRFTLFAPDYKGEKLVEYAGRRYGVYRTYRARGELLELYVEDKAGA